jgi:PAS domain-containing protein/DNA-binding CsgD family transcriptional regulator
MSLKQDFSAALLDETNDIVFLMDEGFRIRESSRLAQAILGLKSQSPKGIPLTDLLSEKDDGSLAEALAGLGKTGKKTCVEASLRLPDEGNLKVKLVLRALPPGENKTGRGRSRILAIGSRLDSSSEGGDPSRFGPLVARVLRGYGDPVFVFDMASRTILNCNEPAVAAFGWKREELVGTSFDKLAKGGAFSEDFLSASRFAYATSGVFQSRLKLSRKDGGSLSCVCTNVALFDDRGLIESVLCILHDKSDEERRKAELGQLVAEAATLAKQLESTASRFLDPASMPRLSERGLSRRHIEIVGRVALGSTTKAIAHELGLAEATVKSHLSTIYRKLEIRSRTELLRYIHDNGYRID